jgi:hypothetical protein
MLMGVIRTKLMQSLLTSIAHDKRFAFFDSDYRNEKKAQVMIHALIVSLVQSANRAPAGILIQNLNFGRNTGDENHVQKLLGLQMISLIRKSKKLFWWAGFSTSAVSAPWPEPPIAMISFPERAPASAAITDTSTATLVP